MRRPRPAARNLTRPTTVVFPGDPAGRAITAGVLKAITPGLRGGSGHITMGDPGSAERAFYGYTDTPQPVLEARVAALPQGTPAIFTNGPNDVTSVPSAQGGSVFLDARYRALATTLMTKG